MSSVVHFNLSASVYSRNPSIILLFTSVFNKRHSLLILNLFSVKTKITAAFLLKLTFDS